MSNEKSKALNVPDNQSAEAALRLPKEPDVSHPNHCCVHQYWAVVETDGTLVRGRNVKYSKYLGTPGQYEVAFTGDISRGVYVATIGRPGIATEPAGEIGVALRCCPPLPSDFGKTVWVDTHDSNGNYANRAFHLVVLVD